LEGIQAKEVVLATMTVGLFFRRGTGFLFVARGTESTNVEYPADFSSNFALTKDRKRGFRPGREDRFFADFREVHRESFRG
jgi:hypothetical protein